TWPEIAALGCAQQLLLHLLTEQADISQHQRGAARGLEQANPCCGDTWRCAGRTAEQAELHLLFVIRLTFGLHQPASLTCASFVDRLGYIATPRAGLAHDQDWRGAVYCFRNDLACSCDAVAESNQRIRCNPTMQLLFERVDLSAQAA